ncbi:Ser/Thr phosphatase family protein [Dictyocaulus viviparus]|uniref:Purple acid phosphatase n=1 Tax=Dictyocaulus viviparus TaxID=29172 RepID=A0A0D8XT03_DICVI|nr:Ser/Thr phosphatase family protein [Dictyocaulus viviparus]
MNLHVLLICTMITAREYLPLSRIPSWKTDNPNYGPDYGQPEQIHLSMGSDPTEMIVTWLTFSDTEKSLVNYGRIVEKKLSQVGENTCTVSEYRVGSDYGWSSLYKFTALKPRDDGGYVIAVFGDLGNENARSLAKLQRMAQDGDIDMVLHVGDIAYNMDTDDGRVGDEFLRQIEPIAAYVPYMTAVGNHESTINYRCGYHFNLGSAHFVVFSTEFYFYTEYGWKQIENQWNWLIDDLTKANKNRKNVPWILTFGHRPMYCSDYDEDDCTKYESIVRTGLPRTHAYGLEKLFYHNDVDIEFWAHEHTYERMWPVYNRTVYNGTVSPYVNPLAPVHIVSGSAGCREYTDTFVTYPGPWSARRSTDYGFGILRVYNSTHVHFQQVAAAKDEVQDDLWIVKHPRHSYRRAHRRRQHKATYVPVSYCHPEHCKQHISSKDFENVLIFH